MEVLAIIAALAADAHYINKEDVPDNTVISSQTTQPSAYVEINDTSLAQIDWSKAGNFRLVDSENGVQFVFITN